MFLTHSLVPAILIASGSALAVPTAAAGPATPVSYPAPASAQTYSGLAMDTCAAPTLATIEAWKASPYRVLGAYIGGSSRTCRQDNLTRDWVAGVTTLGWRVLPIYKGLQPPCGARPTDPKISRDPAVARAQGVTAADDAVVKATSLGMQPGSAFYNDIENYSTTDSGCRVAVLSYASGWTQQLHRRGYVSGIYVNLSSGAQDLSAAYSSTSYARPDALWIARYDGNPSLSGWTGCRFRGKLSVSNRSVIDVATFQLICQWRQLTGPGNRHRKGGVSRDAGPDGSTGDGTFPDTAGRHADLGRPGDGSAYGVLCLECHMACLMPVLISQVFAGQAVKKPMTRRGRTMTCGFVGVSYAVEWTCQGVRVARPGGDLGGCRAGLGGVLFPVSSAGLLVAADRWGDRVVRG